jgi:hypothetical protein
MEDQLGAVHLYRSGEAQLRVTERKYLTSEISEVGVSVGTVRGRPGRQSD